MEDVQEYMNSVNEAFGADAVAENVMSKLMESKEAVVAPISTIGTLLAVKAGTALISKLATGAKGVAQNVVKTAQTQVQQKAGQIGQNIKSTLQQKAGPKATEEEPETEVPEETSTEMTDMTGQPLEEGEISQEEALNMINNVPRPDMSDPSLYPEGSGAPEGGAPAEAGEAGEAVQATTQTVAREDLPFPEVEPETAGFTEPEPMAGTTSNVIGRVLQGQQQQAQQAQQAQQEAEAPEEAEEGEIDEDLAQQLIRTGFTQTVQETGGVGALAPEQAGSVSEAIGTTTEALGGQATEAVGQLAGVASQAVSSLTGAGATATGAVTDAVSTGVGAVTDAVTEGIGATIGSALGSAASVLGPIGLIAGVSALIPMFMEMGHHAPPPLNPSTQFI